jgi:hypothetical protein
MPARLYKPKRIVQGTVAEIVNDHMRGVMQCFPGDTKLTLVVRAFGFEKPLIFTNDAPDDAIAAIRDMTTASPNLLRQG